MQAPFWREDPLNQFEETLLRACLEAHAKSVERSNISSNTAVQVAAGSMSYTNAIASAMLSIGNGVHAPLEFTMQLLMEADPVNEVRSILDQGCKVPGWGNSFAKSEPDPIWRDVSGILMAYWSGIASMIDAITVELHDHGKKIYPNPSTWTAAVAIVLRIPPKLAPWLFVAGRLDGWSRLITPYLK